MAPSQTWEWACFAGPAHWGLVCCGWYCKHWDNTNGGWKPKPRNQQQQNEQREAPAEAAAVPAQQQHDKQQQQQHDKQRTWAILDTSVQ